MDQQLNDKILIGRCCDELRARGVPDDALEPIREYVATLTCEGCGARATSGPHGPDSVYLCDDCLEIDLSEQQTIAALSEDQPHG